MIQYRALATHHSVSKHLRSKHTDWHTTLDYATLSNIIGTKPSTKLDISTYKIPKDIKLAGEQFDQPGSIDLLIGADLFYEMLLPGRQTNPYNYPVLQETVLVWSLWSDSNYFHTKGSAAHIHVTRRQQSTAQPKPLLGSGIRGAIHHDNRAKGL